VNGTGTRWTYRDVNDGTLPGGFEKAVVIDRSHVAPGLVRFVIKGKRLGLTAPFPARATLVFDTPQALGGQCAEGTFAASGSPPAP
jgi:hypothetical protein